MSIDICLSEFPFSRVSIKRKHSRFSGLSKEAVKLAIEEMNKAQGKSARKRQKRNRFLPRSSSMYSDDSEYEYRDDSTDYNNVPEKHVLTMHVEQPVHTAEQVSNTGAMYRYSEETTNNVEQNWYYCPHQKTLRQIFIEWGVSNTLNTGDGWNIGIKICEELRLAGICMLPKVGTPPVRLYDTSNVRTMNIIGSVIARHLADKVQH